MYRADTIVACATASGRGAIAIVRWSGHDALAIAARVFRARRDGGAEPWKLRLGSVIAADGTTPLDEGLGVFFPAPHSFTGEDVFEVHTHGSALVVERVIASAIAAGARAAERGEFTRRAVLNGKLDLLQAEAIADLVDARWSSGAEAAWQQLQGALSARIETLRGRLVAVLADIEVQIDFSDDELPDVDFERRYGELTAVGSELRGLLAGFAASRRQREGLRVVFTGRPNAGKSSLLNRLLGSERLIVSDEAGTTRDAVEEAIDLEGVALVLTDTAGLREGSGSIAEDRAVARARERVRDADLRVLVLDASRTWDDEDRRLWRDVGARDTIVVWNKMDLLAGEPDLPAELSGVPNCKVSARTGAGCGELAGAIAGFARSAPESDGAGISRTRHRAAVERALVALERVEGLSRREDCCELAAFELRAAIHELASLTSLLDNEEVLDRIFAEFCLGK